MSANPEGTRPDATAPISPSAADPLRRPPGLLALLRSRRELRVLAAMLLAGAFAAGLLPPILPLFLLSTGARLPGIAGVLALSAVASVGAQLLVARFPGAVVQPRLLLGLMAAPALAWPLLLFARSPLEALGLLVVASAASAAASPGIQFLLARAAPADARAALLGSLGAAWSLAYASGLASSGLLHVLGFRAVFVAAALAHGAVVAFAATTLARGAPARTDRARQILRAHRAVARAKDALERAGPIPAQARRELRLLLAHLGLFTLSVTLYPAYLPVHLRAAGLSTMGIGFVIASSWIAFALAQTFAAKLSDDPRWRRPIVVASVATVAALNLAVAFGPLPLIVLAWALLGVADGLGRPHAGALLLERVPAPLGARAFALAGSARSAALLVGPIAMALLVRLVPLATAIALASVGFAAALLALLPLRAAAASSHVPSA